MERFTEIAWSQHAMQQTNNRNHAMPLHATLHALVNRVRKWKRGPEQWPMASILGSNENCCQCVEIVVVSLDVKI
jgi:hypothetical protein